MRKQSSEASINVGKNASSHKDSFLPARAAPPPILSLFDLLREKAALCCPLK